MPLSRRSALMPLSRRSATMPLIHAAIGAIAEIRCPGLVGTSGRRHR
jgi:hypothetical protein